jgi:hypothetical protein
MRCLAWIDLLVVESSVTVNSCVHFIVVYLFLLNVVLAISLFLVDTLMSLYCGRLQESYHWGILMYQTSVKRSGTPISGPGF